MRIADKTKEQLIEELEALRLRTAELERTEATHKRREEAIRKLEEEKLSILNSMSEHVVYQNPQHRILWANKAAAEAAGLSREQLVGCYCYEVWPKRSGPCADCPVAKARETGKPQASEMTAPDGKVWLVQGYPIRDTEDQIVGLVEMALEVTERKQVEEALRTGEKRYELLFESTLDGMFVLDAETLKVVLANQAAVDIYGLNSVEEAIGLNVLDCVPPEERERVLRLIVKDLFENDLRQVSEFRGITRDGREIWVSAVGTKAEYRGKLAGLISFRDITERKEAEEILRESKEFNASLLENSPNPVVVINPDSSIRYVNPALERLTGYTFDEVIGMKHPRPWWVEGKTQETLGRIRERQPKGGQSTEEVLFQKKNGEQFWVNVGVSMIERDGELSYTLVNWVDITERKKAEEALQTEKNKLQSVVGALEYGLTIQDRDYNVLYQSGPLKKYFGEHVGDKCYQVYEGRDTICDDCPVKKAFKDGKSHSAEKKGNTPSGEIFIMERTACPIRNAEGEIVSCLEVTRDITEHKKAEDALREGEEKYRTIFENVSEVIIRVDRYGKIVDVNGKAEECFGYKPEEVIGKNFAKTGVLSLKDLPKIVKLFGDIIRGKRAPIMIELEAKRKDGSPVLIEVTSKLVKKNGKAEGFVAIVRDITERKRAEEALRESKEFNASLLENSPNPVVVINPDTSIRYVNPALEKLTGFKSKEVISIKQPFPWWIDNKTREIMDRIRKKLSKGGQAREEVLFQKKNGERFWVNVNATMVKRNGKPSYTLVNWVNVTERKRAEEAVRESEEKLRKMFESVTDGISVVNLDGIITDVNQRTVEMHGFGSRDEILGKSALELIAPADHKRVAANMRKALTRGIIRGVEYTLLKADGSEFPGELSTNVLKNAAGEAIGHITIARDITKRKEAEDLYGTLANSSPVGVYIIQDGKFQFVNSQFQKYTGFSEDELLNKESLEIVHPEDEERVRENAVDMLKGKRLSPYELRYIVKSGEILWATETVTSIHYRGKRAVLGNFIDITERKRTEEALERQRAYFQQLFDNSPEAIVLLDTNNRIVNINKGFETLFGYTMEEVKDQPLSEVIVPENHVEEAHTLSQAYLNNEVSQGETVRKRKDGSRVDVALLAYPIRSGDKVVGAYVIYRDITEQKRAQEELRESEELYRNLFEGTHDMIQSVTPDGHFILVNRAWLETMGYTEAELPDLNLFQIIHPESLPHCQEMFAKVMEGESVNNAQATFVAKDGRSVIVEGDAIGYYVNGELVATQGIFRDITERKRAEEELKLRAQILDNATDSIFVHDADDNFIYVNEAACRAHGYSRKEFMKMKIPQLVDPKRVHPLAADRQEILDKGYIVTESTHLRKDGSLMPVEVHARIIESGGRKLFLNVVRDITERKRMEEEREEMEEKAHLASRLASVGEMASGIAHEINNPLTSVIGFSQLLMEGDVPADVKEDVGIIYKEAQRAAGVAKNLLTFARKQAPAKQPTNINSIIEGVLKLRAYEQRVNNIQVDSQLAPDLPEVMADYSQLQQVFINLIINAESAMIEANKGGTLTITTQRVNKTVKASFSDDGPGITKENLDRIFDPFFTTKEVGKGTGLGLSVCHGIVAEHKGRIYARSRPGKGATFIVELPVNNS